MKIARADRAVFAFKRGEGPACGSANVQVGSVSCAADLFVLDLVAALPATKCSDTFEMPVISAMTCSPSKALTAGAAPG
jgi:hypothetical protein